MPTPDVLASTIMDGSAALLNDVAQTDYTYAAQLPYLRIALNELRELLELNNVPVTNKVSSPIISVPAGISSIGFNTIPALPADLIEIQKLWTTTTGTENWIPVTRKEFIAHYWEGVQANQFSIWAWQDNAIKFPSSNAIVDIKFDYIKSLFTVLVGQNTNIGVINSESFLTFRTAGLCAEFIGENKERADSLNTQAELAKDRILGIDSKSRQSIMTRRRPFRSGYKSR